MSRPERFDCLYVSPHAEDAALSCLGSMVEESQRGLRLLVANVFGKEPPAPTRERRPTGRLGAEQVFFDLPEASGRLPRYDSFRSMMGEPDALDEPWLDDLARRLGALARDVQPRHVYIPLGVWSHVDHRLAFEAARSVFEPGAGRDVFFYEERPYALLSGTVRIRLGQIGARLPPVVAGLEGGGLLRFVMGFHSDPYVRRHFSGLLDGLRSSRMAARSFREARQWRPLKAFGPRLQPILHSMSPQAVQLLAECATEFPTGSPFGPAERLAARLAAHGRRVGQDGAVERYWLLLPARDDATTPEPDAAGLAAKAS